MLVDVNGDGSAGSLDRRVLRNHYAESLPVVPTAPSAAGVPSAPLIPEDTGYMRMMTLRREPVGVSFLRDVEGWASASEESGYRHMLGLRPGREGVPVFFSCDVEGAGAGGWIVIDDGVTANEAQLEPDLQPGLADPLGGDVL